jgi:hypothetical protein
MTIAQTKASRALQAAEKLAQLVGRGFIPGFTPIKRAVALATEVCFLSFLPQILSFSASSSAPVAHSENPLGRRNPRTIPISNRLFRFKYAPGGRRRE